MPEGHTIHRSARDLAELRGHALRAFSPQGRFAEGAARLDGAVLTFIEAVGKHLFLGMDDGDHLHVHLGMQGKWFRYDDPTTPPLKQARLRLASATVAWDLVAPSTCQVLNEEGVRRITAGLGPDPLRPGVDGAPVVAALAADPRPVGSALLDQALVAGVGNVFRNEALHAVGVHPARPGRSVATEDLTELWAVLQRMMSRAVEDGRIITVEAADRLAVPEAEARKVYKQERCRDCGAPVTVGTVGGRTAYWCPVEQPDQQPVEQGG